MKQYCRHCAFIRPGRVLWCGKRQEAVSMAVASSPNRCHDFAYSHVDVFGEDEKRGGRPSGTKKKQCDGQIGMF